MHPGVTGNHWQWYNLCYLYIHSYITWNGSSTDDMTLLNPTTKDTWNVKCERVQQIKVTYKNQTFWPVDNTKENKTETKIGIKKLETKIPNWQPKYPIIKHSKYTGIFNVGSHPPNHCYW